MRVIESLDRGAEIGLLGLDHFDHFYRHEADRPANTGSTGTVVPICTNDPSAVGTMAPPRGTTHIVIALSHVIPMHVIDIAVAVVIDAIGGLIATLGIEPAFARIGPDVSL